MKTNSRVLSLALGGVFLLGIPITSLLTVASHEAAGTAAARPSNIDLFYKQWETRYVQSGGDREAVVGVSYVEGLSLEFTRALGRIDLDLERGTVRAEVRDLKMAADVWLIDNEDGKSVAPEPGDRMVRLGRLTAQGEAQTVSAKLGEDFFRDFELDLVVVTRAGQSPVESRVLVGSRSLFERLHTHTRLAALKKQEERAAGLGRVARLAGMFSPKSADANQIMVSHGLVSALVDDGAELFFRETFGGNGRTCGTCHRVQKNQGLEADFIATLPANDPLFVAEFPVNQGGVPGLERPALMRNFGLILENADGFANPTVKFTMRGVPHSLSMATSILAPSDGRPQIQRTGWSGDGAPGSGALRLFPVGAVTQHFPKRLNRVAGVDFVLPTDAQLDAMEAFSLASGRLNELNLNGGVTLSDPGAEAGRLVFLSQGKCNNCHGNAGGLSPLGGNRNFNTGTERVTNPARAVENFPFDGGHGTANFDSNGDTVNDSFGDGTFNTPPLIESADTAPFFHNNISATIEDAVAFYSSPEFNNSPAGIAGGGISLTAAQNSDVGDFLRVINAAFNAAIAIQRMNAAGTLENESMFQPAEGARMSPFFGEEEFVGIDGKKETVDALLRLANIELNDALDVLNAKGLHLSAASLISQAVSENQQALNENSTFTRVNLIESAVQKVANAKAQFGTGLNFTLGEGNLLF